MTKTSGEFPLLSRALSAVPELLAATSALLREAEGPSRADRELVAAAVSRANRCRPCLDVHLAALRALGENHLAEAVARGGTPSSPRHAALVAWAEASRNPRATRWTSPYGPELTGTVLAAHFVNRVVSALPGGPPGPGDGGAPQSRHSPVGAAYVALRDAALAGGDLLSETARQTVEATVRWEDGWHPIQPAAWAAELVEDLPGKDRAATRTALLAAFAPGEVARRRLTRPAGADLVRLVAFGAITATDHVARALAPAHR
jgi:AhpD family alkylhydroperoxidase